MSSTSTSDGAIPVPAEANELQTTHLTPEELRLVERARAGEQRALREIYEAHQGQVRGHLYRLMGPDCEIDDLVQTVFFRAFNAIDRFQGQSSLRTWLYRITANTTHNTLRQRFRRQRVVRAFRVFTGSVGLNQRSSHISARDEIGRILQQLRPELREVFVLYHYEGLTLQEISKTIDVPISTVGDRLARTRKRLRDLVS